MLIAREIDKDAYENRTLIWYQSLGSSLVVNNLVLKIFRSYRMKISLSLSE